MALAVLVAMKVGNALAWLLCAIPFVVGAWALVLVAQALLKFGNLSDDASVIITLVVVGLWGYIMVDSDQKMLGFLIITICAVTLFFMVDPSSRKVLTVGWNHLMQLAGPIGEALSKIPNP